MNISLAAKSGHSLPNWDSENSSFTDMDLWVQPQQDISKRDNKLKTCGDSNEYPYTKEYTSPFTLGTNQIKESY